MTKNQVASLLWEFPIVDVVKNVILIPSVTDTMANDEPFRHYGIQEYHFGRPVMDVVRAAERAGEYVSDYVQSQVGVLGLRNNPQVGYKNFVPFTYSEGACDDENKYFQEVTENLLNYVADMTDQQAEKAIDVM